jgi:hypothetical protein
MAFAPAEARRTRSADITATYKRDDQLDSPVGTSITIEISSYHGNSSADEALDQLSEFFRACARARLADPTVVGGSRDVTTTTVPPPAWGSHVRADAVEMQSLYASKKYPHTQVVVTSHNLLAAAGHNVVQGTATIVHFGKPAGAKTQHRLQELNAAAVAAALNDVSAP